jgi:hypothetical protein
MLSLDSFYPRPKMGDLTLYGFKIEFDFKRADLNPQCIAAALHNRFLAGGG